MYNAAARSIACSAGTANWAPGPGTRHDERTRPRQADADGGDSAECTEYVNLGDVIASALILLVASYNNNLLCRQVVKQNKRLVRDYTRMYVHITYTYTHIRTYRIFVSEENRIIIGPGRGIYMLWKQSNVQLHRRDA